METSGQMMGSSTFHWGGVGLPAGSNVSSERSLSMQTRWRYKIWLLCSLLTFACLSEPCDSPNALICSDSVNKISLVSDCYWKRPRSFSNGYMLSEHATKCLAWASFTFLHYMFLHSHIFYWVFIIDIGAISFSIFSKTGMKSYYKMGLSRQLGNLVIILLWLQFSNVDLTLLQYWC